MKKILILLIVALAISCNSRSEISTIPIQRYKMYPTENIHILLKMNTQTGEVWMVQYGLNDVEPMEIFIPYSNIISSNKSWNGRFELYPTQNMYNFISIDTYNGKTYQVQWGNEEKYRFTTPIVK